MKKRISLLLPTRGRPTLVERFLRSVVAESTHPELIEIILCVDDDDTGSHGITFSQLSLRTVIVPRQTMGAYNSICFQHATGDITIAVNDDIVVRTKGWDDKVRELDARYPDGIYLAYGNDLLKGARLCTFPILSRRAWLPPAVPYPVEYKGAFIDVHLMDIFKRLQKRGHQRIMYEEDLVFEHLHYRNHPEALDATYTDRSRFGDDLTFIALREARRLEADRLDALIANTALASAPSPRRAGCPSPGLFSIISLCLRSFLFDSDLPIKWRAYLFAWLVTRYYFSRIFNVA
ncbi:glycosyltransferase family 2 protein [Bradyrhizobium sp. CCGB12]|uniref:glycosyltransferase family 2 protein n=1 Tax=Bradyrhizobium sp. CCGB12 TaxID=2949632 RepID=UPI0020B201C7|nr:glycosyltransferase family A protein [Bradyrhizobium sp. CCGB12]MCP3391892.1 glycosyltransferase family 2 protein [Bradyrhizobium sp. CCGB12]